MATENSMKRICSPLSFAVQCHRSKTISQFQEAEGGDQMSYPSLYSLIGKHVQLDLSITFSVLEEGWHQPIKSDVCR